MRKARNPASAIAMPSAPRLGVACYVPEDEGHLSFIEGDTQDASQALPYEWYRPRKTRVCGEAQDPTRSTLVIWIPDGALSGGFFATLTSLSQALVCQEATRKNECLLTDDQRKLVRLNPAVAAGRHVQDRGASQFLGFSRAAG